MGATWALPRIRVRVRRPRPRPPAWWWRAAWMVAWMLLATWDLTDGRYVNSAGCCLFVVSDWRTLRRWPENSLSGPSIDSTTITLTFGAFALILAGLVV